MKRSMRNSITASGYEREWTIYRQIFAWFLTPEFSRKNRKGCWDACQNEGMVYRCVVVSRQLPVINSDCHKSGRVPVHCHHVQGWPWVTTMSFAIDSKWQRPPDVRKRHLSRGVYKGGTGEVWRVWSQIFICGIAVLQLWLCWRRRNIAHGVTWS